MEEFQRAYLIIPITVFVVELYTAQIAHTHLAPIVHDVLVVLKCVADWIVHVSLRALARRKCRYLLRVVNVGTEECKGFDNEKPLLNHSHCLVISRCPNSPTAHSTTTVLLATFVSTAVRFQQVEHFAKRDIAKQQQTGVVLWRCKAVVR